MPDMTDERRASSLDIADEEARELAARAVGLALECLAPGGELPVFPDTSAEEVARLFRLPLPEEGAGLDALERDFREVVNHVRLNNHPRMFGYIASPATHVGAFASLVASSLNSNVTSWRSAPAATEVERTVVGWLAEMIGYAGGESRCGGLLTSGGSMANLVALYVAHRTKAREGSDALRAESAHDASQEGLWNAGAPMTLYASDQVHLSIPKAADVLGLGRKQVRAVPSDENFMLDVRALRELIDADARRGLRPFCVVASAGTVSTGAVDPLADIARVARERALWFHVDGAYGVLAAADESRRHLFAGLEAADSVSLDPHKWLYTPVDCGCLLLRRAELARSAFAGTEEGYIKVFESGADEAFAFWDYGVELSRPFRALKVWATLRYYGARKIAAAIAEDNALAEYLAARVRESEDFELLAPATLGICCFRYVPPAVRRELEQVVGEDRERFEARLDALNERVMLRAQRAGRAYVSNAVLRGRFALRASITNFRTTREDLDITLDALRAAASDESL
ncbi:MAG TPA: aminotransferase class V-fold PLP-dependent enzyme [Pyrinomonadaceae bacterium]